MGSNKILIDFLTKQNNYNAEISRVKVKFVDGQNIVQTYDVSLTPIQRSSRPNYSDPGEVIRAFTDHIQQVQEWIQENTGQSPNNVQKAEFNRGVCMIVIH